MSKLNLAPREKRLVAFMFTVMIAMTVIPIVRNVSSRHTSSVAQLRQAEERLVNTRILNEAIVSEREGQRVIQQKLNARPRNFDLYNFTQQLITREKLQGRADLQSKGGTARESAFDGVQVTLKNVSLKEIVDFTHGLYASNNLITMQRMSHLLPSRDGKGMECAIVMIAPKR
jgi:hypothetical protein